MRKVVITGGNGGMAKVTAQKFSEAEYDVLSPERKELDVSDYNSVKEYFDKNKPDVLINAAGFIKPDRIDGSDVAVWKKHIDVNLLGVYYCIREALKHNKKTIVINIASTSGLEGRPEWSAYCASKSAVISMSQALAHEGYQSYCISPARTKTAMRKMLFPDEDQSTLIDPEEIANIVFDIIENNNKYENGINIIARKNGQTIQKISEN
jgi:3-oxoacyl-[acyl-carrier protein] reductase